MGDLSTPLSAELDGLVRSEQLAAVRRRIFRQLVESLIYEGIVRPETEPEGDGLAFCLHGEDEQGQPVSYLCYGRRRFSFDRVQLDGRPVLRIAGERAEEADSPTRFLLETRAAHGAPPERLLHFIGELEQTLLKDAQAQLWWARRELSGGDASYDELESQTIDGHPYHPSYKSRLGFTLADNRAFGPEFAPLIRPVWLAARREWTRVAASGELDQAAFLDQELGAERHQAWRQAIRERGLDPDAYALVPVHPWQWREQICTLMHEDLRAGDLILLGEADEYRPQQSIRTLSNHSAPHRAYLKHSLSIINTSTGRILAPHTVQNAPPISDWLHGIVRGDPLLRDELRVVVLREVLGAAYDRPRDELLHPRTYGILSCIWRESLHPHLDAGEQALPWSALCGLDGAGRPLIAPWVGRAGVEQWTSRLLEVSVLPIVHMLMAHGIALESHAQNMILIHREGRPQRVALKDFHDGIRFAPQHLAAPERAPALHATPARHVRVNRNSYITADTAEAARDFMLDAFCFINLSELALFLSAHFGLAEPRFWALAHAVIAGYQRRFPQLQERFELFDLYTPLIEVERLTNRRLFPETDVQVHRVRNPLALLRASGACDPEAR